MSRVWYAVIDPEIGYCWGGSPGNKDHVVRMIFMHRPKTMRFSGRRSFDHQPNKPMKVGWYADYMKDEWSVTKRGFRKLGLYKKRQLPYVRIRTW